MKKFILLLLFFAAKNITSQNGWTTYTASIPTGTAATQENIIFIDNAGNKWVGFNGGAISNLALAKLNNTTNTWTFWNKASMGITSSTISNNVRAFTEDNSGNIWIGTTSGLFKYDGSNFTVFTVANGLPSNGITCLEFSNNMLYIGTQNGLSRYDGLNFINYNVANSLFPLVLISDVKAENANTIWITGGNRLVNFFISSTYTSTSYTVSATTNTYTTLDRIYIDAAGTKWFVNQTQIIKYNNINFTYFDSMYPDFTGVSNFDPYSICKGPNNGVLVSGTNYNGPSNFRQLVEFLPNGKCNFFSPPMTPIIGYSFKNDVSGKIWMTGAVATSTLSGPQIRIHSLDPSLYKVTSAFGIGTGVTPDNYKFLDINRVKAGIMNRGDMHWDIGTNGQPGYAVPINSTSYPWTPSSDYASSLWIGGLDASNQLYTAGQMYRQTGNDFWPGPLDTTNASIDTATAVKYDKIWKVSTDDINTFLYQFSLGNVPLSYTPTPDILSWPAKGTGNNSRNLAPFVDVNNNGIYDPLIGGDYPKIKGDQTLYFIFNDNLGPHSQTGGLPFGIEVHSMAYAYGCTAVLNGRTELAYTTFYDYKIFNRSNNNYHDVYCGLWSDADLGNYIDDYIGSSISDNLGFIYNSDGYDDPPSGGWSWYDFYPPACGRTVLKGPLAPINDLIDNDNDSLIDELGEECLMNVFDYFNNPIGPFPTGAQTPVTKYHYYNYLTGKWKDSTNFTCGGNAYGGTTPTKFVYPWSNYNNNPCASPWTELTAGNLAGDRRYLLSSGPFNLPAKGNVELEYAQVWSVDSFATSNVNLASANKLINDTRKIRSFYKSGVKGCAGVNIGINELLSDNELIIYPNPANSVLNIKSETGLGKNTISITDILGKTIIETKNNDLYQTSINIEQLNSGVYLLQLRSEKGLTVKKFIKQ